MWWIRKKMAVFGSNSHQKVESISPLLECGCGHVTGSVAAPACCWAPGRF